MQDTKKHILEILVENMGRSNILPVMNTQRKGKGTLLSVQKKKNIISKTTRDRKPGLKDLVDVRGNGLLHRFPISASDIFSSKACVILRGKRLLFNGRLSLTISHSLLFIRRQRPTTYHWKPSKLAVIRDLYKFEDENDFECEI